jgi:transposase
MTLPTVSLNPSERGELHAQLRRRNLPASVAQRIRIVLLLADGASYGDIQEQLGTPASTIARWKKRYEERRLLGLVTLHPGQPPRLMTPELRAKILNKIKEAPPDGSTHWSVRKMAKVLKVGKDLVHKVFK